MEKVVKRTQIEQPKNIIKTLKNKSQISKRPCTRQALREISNVNLYEIKSNNLPKKLKILKSKNVACEEKKVVIRDIPVKAILIELNQEETELNSKGRNDPNNERPYSFHIYNYWLVLEERNRVRQDYLEGGEVTAKMRSILVDWLVEVSEHFHLLQETLHRSVGLVDRYLQAQPVTRDQLQLVGLGALSVATKYEEGRMPQVDHLVLLCDHSFTAKQIFAMERKILATLNFSLGFPVPVTFLKRFSQAANFDPLHHTYSMFFTDMALYDYSLCHVRASKLSSAATFISLALQAQDTAESRWTKALISYSSYDLHEIKAIVQQLAKTILSTTIYNSVYKKYKGSSMYQVSITSGFKSSIEILSTLAAK